MATNRDNNYKSRTNFSSRFFRGNRRFRPGGNFNKRPKQNIPSSLLDATTTQSPSSAECLQKNEFFAAPKYTNDNQQLQVISVLNPVQYSGWRLYFSTESYLDSSPLVSHIKAFENHIQKYPQTYNISEICQKQWFKVSVDFVIREDDDFRLSWSSFSKDLEFNPDMVLSCLGLAMHQTITTYLKSLPDSSNCTLKDYKIKKYGLPKIFPRPVDFLSVSNICQITSQSLDKMFVVHGLVSCIAGEEVKCNFISYKCRHCGQEQAIRQTDYLTKPLRCNIQCKNKRNFVEIRSSSYTTIECVQMMQLQEVGSQFLLNSDHIDVELQHDLVNEVYPGLELTVMGILKSRPLVNDSNLQKRTKQNFYLKAISLWNNVTVNQCEKDDEIVQMISMEKNFFRLLVQSLAPEMCGYEMLKLAVLLSLFGGCGSQVEERNELNVLLVGDPGLGKSNLLKNAACVSRRGTLTSVKSPSIILPSFQSENNSIDVGSILTSNAGHCCIDDMEKLTQNHEALIHIMQTRSITSRGHNMMFNANTKSALIAAVNPAKGHYVSSKLLRENIGLNPSFLSLFHLIFLMYDKADKDGDASLTEHIKALHSGMKQVLSVPAKYSMEYKPSNLNRPNYELSLAEQLNINVDEQLDLLPAILLKKYIEYARCHIKPLLSKEAATEIKEYYMTIRTENNETEQFLTTSRQLEGLILFTQARARIELCIEATKQHALDIINLFSQSYKSFVDQFNTTLNESISGTSRTSHGSQVKKFIQMLEIRSNALGKTTFEMEELKQLALHVGIKSGVTDVIDFINMQGYLRKKGQNVYEFRS